MRKVAGLFFLALLFLSLAAAQPQSASAYERLKAEAEREYAQKSFRRARELYAQMSRLELPPEERRFVRFRLAETTLREARTGGVSDPQTAEKARQTLVEIAQSGPDEISASAHEALGDVDNNQQHYVAALDFWAGSSDLPRARRRYLEIVWKVVRDDNFWNAPRHVLVSAVQIAETPEERGRTRYLLARQYMSEGTPASIERALELLEEVIAIGKSTSYYDDALYYYASSLAQRDVDAEYTKALQYYRRLVNEFKEGETPWRDYAARAIDEILEPSVGVHVAGTFLPESEQEVLLTWRNVSAVELTLHAVDLTRDAHLDRRQHWMHTIRTDGKPLVRRWTYPTNDTGEHHPGRTDLRLEPRLPAGAYILTAAAKGRSSRQLVLVTDAHILVHSGQERMDVYVSSVLTGEPIANARVHLRQQVERNQSFVEHEATTNANGLARIALRTAGGTTLLTAAAGSRQAFHQTYTYRYGGGSRAAAPMWRVYAFTDRPAYRPGETVRWKILARIRENEEWVTPAGAELEYEIMNPRGEKTAGGVARLSAFGSFWAELPLTEEMPLGAYSINFKTRGPQAAYAGGAQLFRLEEYKLPEFLVQVRTPEGKQYRLGDTIEATIEASYYFGGPVANATVEVVVWQQPFHRYWYPRHYYAWLHEPPPPPGGGMITRRETLRTDAEGRAVLRIDTPRDAGDLMYRIEARVVDASRREVRGAGSVRVTRQRYTVMARPEHFVHRPGDSVSVDFKALDANDQPVQVTGTVTVVRRVHRQETKVSRVRPPRHVDEEIVSAKVTTDAKGEATFTFTPRTTGYYVVKWTSTDGTRARDIVTAETAVWVAERTTTDVGYRASGLDLIVDKDTLREGETANVMVVTPSSGRWVLFSTVGDDILDTQVLRLDGSVKLVQIPVTKQHAPNFFVTASSVFDVEFATDSERLVVPPVEQFLSVEVKSDREEYEPRQDGTVTVTTRDASGQPVAAEVALAVSDEAVTAIQQDTAGDPRQFFYDQVRHNVMQVSAGVHAQRYLKLEEQAREEAAEEGRGARLYDTAAAAKMEGTLMGRVGGAMAPPPAPVPPPPPPAAAPAEAITVTAAAAPQAAEGIDVQVRTDFRSTAFWKPDVITDAGGMASVRVKYPEALTTWRATARAASAGAQFGMASATARTSMPLLVRLQGPRFFVTGDEVVVSAVINNNTDAPVDATPVLHAEGVRVVGGWRPALSAVEGLAVGGGEARRETVRVPAHGDVRVDWTVVAEKAGPAKLRVAARSSELGDAMERAFLVYEHGIDKLIARSGKMRGSEAIVRLDLPRERRATELTVQVSPSLATTLLDALPYLIDFPYGCTEQTMSRFLPAAIVTRTLEKLGLGRARVAGKDLDKVTRAGIARLFDMQHDDGSWGWWKESPSDPWMTAYVVWGFSIAREGGVKFDHSRVDRAAAWLDRALVQYARSPNDQAWMLHALASWNTTISPNARRAFDTVYADRERLTPYSRALLAMAAHRWDEDEAARVLVRNLEDGVQIDATPDQSVLLPGQTTAETTMQTAYWGARGLWWRWYEGPVETTAFVLRALVTIDPENRLIEPAMNWLVKNRRGTQWSNTRDTAISLLALNDYLQQSGELAADTSYELSVNGNVVATRTITAADVLGAPTRFSIDPSILTDARQEVRIRRTGGSSPLYFAAEARFVSLEEPVAPAGNELFVRREYFRLAPRPTLLKGVEYDRVPLRDRDSIASGERVEVVVTVETKNDYTYLLFEDLKRAGFEAVELQSGTPLYATSKSRGSAWVYQELRDRKVAMFVDRLDQGIWEIRYTLRAEVPGSFHALPLLGQAFYVPDIRANGEEVRVRVTE